ncbi:MAG: 3-hydroxyacyl-CoA dehydrogenase PaaH [Duganella sp.]
MAALPFTSTVAVIGSGAMGAGIAQVAALAGHTVKLFDNRADAVAKAIADITLALNRQVVKGRLGPTDAAAAIARLQPALALADVADAVLVVEAIVEQLDAKRALLRELEAIVSDDCILATNTSSISVTAIGAGLRLPGRLAGMHFFNPVPLMALVEVVSGLATDAGVAQTVFDTAAAWGKRPVHACSTPGFIVNRVARPYYAEAWRLLAEQAADAATIDAVLRETGGFRMGPFELMDLIGHDVNFSVTQSVFAAYFNDPRFTPSVLQQELVSAGFFGRKAGRGCYHYVDGQQQAVQVQTEAPQAAPDHVSYSGHADVVASASAPHGAAITDALAARLRQAGIEVALRKPHHAHGHGVDDAPVFHCNGAAVYLSDGRSATRRAADNGHANTVLIDLALDYGSATRIAVARSDQCAPAAYQAVVGLFQAAGLAVTCLDDTPGMAVMRTVAMLANEAADAVNQGVCSAAGADTAMQQGVNYPRGPLAWADAIGLGHVIAVLDNLAASYGEDRYRVSPLLRRRHAAGAPLHAVHTSHGD